MVRSLRITGGLSVGGFAHTPERFFGGVVLKCESSLTEGSNRDELESSTECAQW